MTGDEKFAVIAGSIRDAARMSDVAGAYTDGALFELAQIIIDEGADDVLSLARLVIPSGDREMLARFCRIYYKYNENLPVLFPQPETAELQNTVIIPEIGKLEEAVAALSEGGLELEISYGDSFSACAEDALYGHSKYVLMPLTDPVEGRLLSFDRLREKYGFKIHAAVNVKDDEAGVYSYQLCALGFPNMTDRVPQRLSFTADVDADPLTYVRGIEVLDARVLSLKTEGARVKAVLACDSLDLRGFAALMMYLSDGADITVDGCYDEL